VSDIGSFRTSGDLVQEVAITDGAWEYQQIVYDPNQSLLYLLSSKEGAVRIEAIPVETVNNATSRLKYDSRTETLQASVSTRTTTFHSLVIYPQCGLLYFLSYESKPSIFTVDLEAKTVKETKLKVDMKERVVIMQEGALVVDYRTGYLWAIACKGDCERKDGETILLHISDSGLVSYNGTIIPNGHDDTNTITAFDQLYGTLYVLSQSKLFAATLKESAGTMLDDVPLLYHTYGDDNGGLGSDCLIFVPTASKLPAIEAGLGECNIQHNPVPSPSFITPAPSKTRTVPPTPVTTPIPKSSGPPSTSKNTGSIIGVVSGGSFLFLLMVGFAIWWRTSTSFSGHSPLENEDGVEMEDLENKKNLRRIKHRRFTDEENVYNQEDPNEEKSDYSHDTFSHTQRELEEEEENQRKVKPHHSILLEDDDDDDENKSEATAGKENFPDEDFKVTQFLEEEPIEIETAFPDIDREKPNNKNASEAVEDEENVFDIE